MFVQIAHDQGKMYLTINSDHAILSKREKIKIWEILNKSIGSPDD